MRTLHSFFLWVQALPAILWPLTKILNILLNPGNLLVYLHDISTYEQLF